MDAKFGFYTHWLISSVPAFGSEWYPRQMYEPGTDEYKHQISTYGPLTPTNGFKEFIPKFTGEHFNAQTWMELFQKAGALFAGPVGEHHDGFPMYNCSLTPYTAVKMGPKRDVAAELLAASKALPKKMYFILSSHRAWHFAFYNTGRKDSDSDVIQCACPGWNDQRPTTPNADPIYCDLYCPANPNEVNPTVPFMDNWLLRTCEMADLYTPDVFYFDWWIGVSPLWQPYVQKFAAFYYNRLLMDGKVGVINTKGTTMPSGADVLDFERGQACAIQKRYWQTDTSISERSWGFIENDVYKSPSDLINNFVDIVSKNGGLLLNVGPPPNGTIPTAAVNTLLEMGSWLSVVGDAIYQSRPYHIFNEGPTQVPCGSFTDDAKNFTKDDFRFTVNPQRSVLYAICMGAAPGDSITITLLGSGRLGTGTISNVQVLGTTGNINWKVTADGLTVNIPSTINIPKGLPPVLAISGLSDIQWDGIVRQGQDNSLNLYASLADTFLGNVELDVAGAYIVASKWDVTPTSAAVQWTVKVRTGGNYKVSVLSASPSNSRVGVLSVQTNKVQITLPQTASTTDFKLSNSYPVSLTAGSAVVFNFKLQSTENVGALSGLQLATIQLVPAN